MPPNKKERGIRQNQPGKSAIADHCLIKQVDIFWELADWESNERTEIQMNTGEPPTKQQRF
jgi:hypothetical protein